MASGTTSGTTGRVTEVDLPDGREDGREGSAAQWAASTSECVGYSVQVFEDAICAAKEATVGVLGVDGADLDEETAKRWVGNDADGGG